MKNKKTFCIIIAIIIVIAAVIAIMYAINPKSNTDSVNEQTTANVTNTTIPATAPTEVTVKDESTFKPTKDGKANEVPDAVQGKYWYLYDDEKLTVYVFEFGKNNQVNLAFFGKETIEGLDAEYTKGYSVYYYNDGKVTIKDLPDEFPISSFSFEIKNGKVMQGKTELEAMDDLSLDNALRHFV